MSSPLSELANNTPIEDGVDGRPLSESPGNFPTIKTEDAEETTTITPAKLTKTPTKAANGSSPAKPAAEKDKNALTEREEHLLKVAVAHCLKGGPPEIDFDKFVDHGEFKTLKTAQNTWGKIRAKLNAAAGATPKATPSKKRAAEEETPKTPAKKGKKTVTAGADRVLKEDEE